MVTGLGRNFRSKGLTCVYKKEGKKLEGDGGGKESQDIQQGVRQSFRQFLLFSKL